MDMAHSKSLGADLNRLIEHHSRRKNPDQESRLWRESVRRYDGRLREENRLACCDCFLRLAG